MNVRLPLMILAAVLLAGEAMADPGTAPAPSMRLVNRSRRPDDACASFEPSVRALLASPLFARRPALSDQELGALLRTGTARALAHGLVYSNDVVGYLILMRHLGADFEQRHPAMVATLRQAKLPGWQRLEKLFAPLGLQRLDPVLGCFTACGVFRRVRWGEPFDFEMNDVAVAADGTLLSSRSASEENGRYRSIGLTIHDGMSEGTVTVGAGESGRFQKLLVSSLAAAPPRPHVRGARLVVRETNQPRARLQWRAPIELTLGQTAVGPDGLEVEVKRIFQEGATCHAVLGLKAGSSSGEVWLDYGTKDHRQDTREKIWYDYRLSVQELVVRRHPDLSRLKVVVEKPKDFVARAAFGQWVTIKHLESARFPDGLVVSHVGWTHGDGVRADRPGGTPRGVAVWFLRLKLSLGGKETEEALEVQRTESASQTEFTRAGYRIEVRDAADVVRRVTLRLTKQPTR